MYCIRLGRYVYTIHTTCQMHDYRHQLQNNILSWVIIPFGISCLANYFLFYTVFGRAVDFIVYARFFSCCILLFGYSVNIIIIFVQRLIQFTVPCISNWFTLQHVQWQNCTFYKVYKLALLLHRFALLCFALGWFLWHSLRPVVR